MIKIRKDVPSFNVVDTVKVQAKVAEGKEKEQIFSCCFKETEQWH